MQMFLQVAIIVEKEVKERFEVLDSWRGIAALLVALFHLGMNSHVFELSLVRNASLFVDFFFVLSGFVLAHAYSSALRKGMGLTGYVIRRVGRLWPLHIAVIIYLVGYEFHTMSLVESGFLSPRPLFSEENARGIKLLVENIFLVQAVGFERHVGWNAPSWSISAEMWVCILFAIICVYCSRKHTTVIAGLLVAAAMLTLWFFAPTYMASSVVFAIPKCIAGFFTGYLVYEFRNKIKIEGLRHGSCIELATVALIVGYLSIIDVERSDPMTMLAPALFAVVVWVFSFEAGAVSRLLRIRPMVWLGTLSYSIYMVHDVISNQLGAHVRGCIVDKAIPGCENFVYISQAFQETRYFADGVAIAYLLMVIAVSTATYWLIENPGRKAFNKLASVVSRKRVSRDSTTRDTRPAPSEKYSG